MTLQDFGSETATQFQPGFGRTARKGGLRVTTKQSKGTGAIAKATAWREPDPLPNEVRQWIEGAAPAGPAAGKQDASLGAHTLDLQPDAGPQAAKARKAPRLPRISTSNPTLLAAIDGLKLTRADFHTSWDRHAAASELASDLLQKHGTPRPDHGGMAVSNAEPNPPPADYARALKEEARADARQSAAWDRLERAAKAMLKVKVHTLDDILLKQKLYAWAYDESDVGKLYFVEDLAVAHDAMERDIRGLAAPPAPVSPASGAASQFASWASERDRLWTEAAGIPDAPQAASAEELARRADLDAQALALEMMIRNAPCDSGEAAIAKLRWIAQSFEDGETGDEQRVMDQVIDFLDATGPHPDAELLALAPELERRWALELSLEDGSDHTDAEFEAAADYTGEIAHRIYSMTATTMVGCRVKAEAIAWGANAHHEPMWADATGTAIRAAAGLIDDLRRSKGSPVEGGEPPATPEDLAAIDYEPLSAEQASVPTEAEWEDLSGRALFSLRIAEKVLQRTKAENAAEAERWGNDDDGQPLVIKMLDQLDNTEEFFRACLSNIEAAKARTMISISTVCVDETEAADPPALIGRDAVRDAWDAASAAQRTAPDA